MRPDRVTSHPRAVRPVAVLLAICCCLSAASGQWLETSVSIPDTFGGPEMPNCLAYDVTDNTVFVAGEGAQSILVLDGESGHRLSGIAFEADVHALCYNPVGNKVYAAAMDRNLVAVIDAGTRQVVDTIPTGDSPMALMYDPTVNRVYCANLHGNVVTVIDGAGDSVLATVPVGQQPFRVCWNPSRNVVYCANRGSNTVTVIDAATDTVVGTIPVDSEPDACVYAAEVNKLYVANDGSSTVTVVDGLADTVLATVAGDQWSWVDQLCYNPVNNKVYVANEGDPIVVIDCASDTVLGYAGVEESFDVVYNSANNRVYAADYSGLSVIDGATDSLLARLDFGSYWQAVCIADSGRRAFGAADEDCVVGVVDCVTDSLLAVIGTDVQVLPSAVCYNPTTDRAYCAIGGPNFVMVIDGTNNAVRQLVPIGVAPSALLHDTFGNKVYCAGGDAVAGFAAIAVIDGEGDSVLRTIEIGDYYDYGGVALCQNTVGNRVYAAKPDEAIVSVVDAVTDTIVCEVPLEAGPYTLCYGPAYNYLYARMNSAVDVIDCDLNLLIAQVDVGSGPGALLYNPVGAKVYAANSSNRTISVIAGERPEVVAQIVVGDDPSALCRDSKDNKVYCADLHDGKVAVIDASADTLVAVLSVGGNPCALSYDSLNNYVYCACQGSNEVVVIDGRRDSVVATVAVGAEPVALAWNPVELRTYVANCSPAGLSVIRDSLHPGIAEDGVRALSARVVTPTLVSGMLPLAGKSRAVLFDIAGREAAELLPGANDIHHLSPGVYFLRREGEKRSVKIVVQR